MNVEDLINRYFEGEITLEEERQLRNFLRENEVPAELQRDKELILSLCEQPSEVKIPDDLSERLSNKIDEWESKSNEQKEAAPVIGTVKKRYTLSRLQWVYAAAAVVALLLTFHLFNPADDSQKDTFDSPQMAYAQVNKALSLFSQAIDKGEKGIEKADEVMNETNEKVIQQVQSGLKVK